MYDFIRQNKRLAQIVLVIIMIPFLFFGVDMFRSGGGGSNNVAKVGDIAVSVYEFDDILRRQRDQARDRMGQAYDPSMFDTPEARNGLLNRVINEKVLQQKANDEKFYVSNEQIAQFLNSIDEFKENGQFSPELYRSLLRQQSMVPALFESMVRQTRLQTPLIEPLQSGEIIAEETAERYYRLVGEKREVAIARLDASAYTGKVKVSDEEVRAYYDQNTNLYQAPETVSLEYILFTRAQVLNQIQISEEEAKQYFADNQERYKQPEKREAAHILFTVGSDAEQSAKDEALKKAEDVLKKAQTAPDTFAELAKEYSEDPGSAQQGGALGEVIPGMLVKPFEETVFNAEKDGIYGPVETQFGYHLIKVTIVPEHQPTFEEAKAQVEGDMKEDRANNEFAEKETAMRDRVFEQTDSFADISQELGIDISRAEFLTRAQVGQLANGNADFANEVFSPVSLNDRQNTEVFDIGNNSLISARVIDHKPAALRPFEEVSGSIRKTLEEKAAFALAVKDGEEKLALLKEKKNADVKFDEPVEVARQRPAADISPTTQAEVFRAPADSLPVYLGASFGENRYVLYRVDKVIAAEDPTPEEIQSAQNLVSQLKGQEVFDTYLTELRNDIEIKIYPEKLGGISQ